MFCDNSAALHFDNEPGVQRGARHYHRRYHYVRESIALGEIRFLKVHTDDNMADPFTKVLPKGKFTQHARSMGLRLASSFIGIILLILGGFAWCYTHAYIEDGVTFIAKSSVTFLAKWVQVPRCIAWLDYDEHVDSLSTMDNEVGVTSPESTTQTLPSFEEYTPLVTYPEEVEKSLGTLIEVEPLNETKLEEVGLNGNHNTLLSSREVPSFDGPEPQTLLNRKSVSLGIDISNLEMFDGDWGLESKEVSPLGEELSLFDRPNEVERGRILEAHRLEPILQQQISQRMVLYSSRWYFAFGRHLEELYVTWGYLEKKIRDKTYEPTTTSIKNVSTVAGDGVTLYNVTPSPRRSRRRHHISRRCYSTTTQPNIYNILFMTAS
ncbi:hypothetical protein Tco_0882736 [Tanacetum coccineum]